MKKYFALFSLAAIIFPAVSFAAFSAEQPIIYEGADAYTATCSDDSIITIFKDGAFVGNNVKCGNANLGYPASSTFINLIGSTDCFDAIAPYEDEYCMFDWAFFDTQTGDNTIGDYAVVESVGGTTNQCNNQTQAYCEGLGTYVATHAFSITEEVLAGAGLGVATLGASVNSVADSTMGFITVLLQKFLPFLLGVIALFLVWRVAKSFFRSFT